MHVRFLAHLGATLPLAFIACSSSSSGGSGSPGGTNDSGTMAQDSSAPSDAAAGDGPNITTDAHYPADGGTTPCTGTASGGVSATFATCATDPITVYAQAMAFDVNFTDPASPLVGKVSINVLGSLAVGTYKESGLYLWHGFDSGVPVSSVSELVWRDDAGNQQPSGCEGTAAAAAGGAFPACQDAVLVVQSIDATGHVHGTFDVTFPAQGSAPTTIVHLQL